MTDQPLEPLDAEEPRASEPSPAEAPPREPAPPPVPAARRLRRSRDDRVIAGVCGGVGEYFGIDSVLVRIAALILVFAGGAGIVLYLIGWIAMPEAPEAGSPGAQPAAPATSTAERTSGAVALGLLFIVLGAVFLVDEVWSDFLSWKYVWPVALISVGAAILVRARR